VAQRIRVEFGDSLLAARLDAGISQRTAATAADMSHSQVSRIERAEIASLTFDQAARAASAVGLRLVVKTYPDGDPARDAGQLALLERFRQRLPREAVWRTEVPLPLPGDRRAWDGLAVLKGRRGGCEAETRLRDRQAVERLLALKLRDGDVDVLILVVADTAANRAFLAAHREQLRGLLPLDTRQVLDALKRGDLPDRSGIVVI
jgi:transcriptional regulator with XRE-family HTH domain